MAALQSLSPAAAVQIGFAELNAIMMAALLPDLILTPLIGPEFDVLELGARLRSLGFSGRLRAVAPPLPDAAIVVEEVRTRLRGIDFALVSAEH